MGSRCPFGGHEPYVFHISSGQPTEDNEYECANAVADAGDAVAFFHSETGYRSQIGAPSLTDEELGVGDVNLESEPQQPDLSGNVRLRVDRSLDFVSDRLEIGLPERGVVGRLERRCDVDVRPDEPTHLRC